MVNESVENKSSESFLWRMHSLKGAFANEMPNNEVVLTVADKGAWNQNMEQLKDRFWPLIKEAYERSDEEVERQLQITFENVDKVFIKHADSKVLGFCCMESHPSDESVGIIRDIIVRKDMQGTGIGKELYASLFSEPKYDAIISATTTLAAEINRFNVGDTKGFKSFYGTMGTGDPEVERLRAFNTDYLRATDVLVPNQARIPDGYEGLVLTKEEYVPRLDKEEVEKMADGPLKDEGRKILELQAMFDERKYDIQPVVAGHLISIRKKDHE